MSVTAEQWPLPEGKILDSLSGPGLKNKISRLIKIPGIYIPYLLAAKMHFPVKVDAKVYGGATVRLPLRDYDALALRAYGFPGGAQTELKLAKFFLKNLKEEDVFYDLGANYGFFSYLASNVCRETHAFEPNHTLAKIIETNATPDHPITVNAVAVSDEGGRIVLHQSLYSGLSTISDATLAVHRAAYESAHEVVVPTITLDDYTRERTRPTYLKLDVEGAEEKVIRGGGRLLSESSPVIAMEVWGSENGREVSSHPVEMLRALGYRSYAINPDGLLREVIGDLSALVPATGGDNFIFKKDA
jgi:FkbM family methyltransferase